MKDKNPPITQYLDRGLIIRLRIYMIVMLVMLVLIAFEVIINTFSITLAIIGILIGLGVGTIVSRMYHLSWDEENSDIIGRIDWIGAVILVFYLVFIFTRAHFLGYWVQGTSLFAIILSITAGTMLGRVLSTRHGIYKILNACKIFYFTHQNNKF